MTNIFQMVKTTNQYFTYNMPLAAKASNHAGGSPRRQNWSFFQEDVLKLKTNCSPWKCTEQPYFFNNRNIFVKPTGWCFPASCFINPIKYFVIVISTINHSSFSHSHISNASSKWGPHPVGITQQTGGLTTKICMSNIVKPCQSYKVVPVR